MKSKEEKIKDLTNELEDMMPDVYEKYKEFKQLEAEFNEIYEPYKAKMLELYSLNGDNIKKTISHYGVEQTYVAPSIRTTIDSKKLQEEEPEIAKKFSKTTTVSATLKLKTIINNN